VAVIAVLAVVAGSAAWYLYRRPSHIGGIRNVVLISIDTCRADHLSCYGFKRATTPHIDAVARDGVVFQQALSPVPITTPAHSSMLTGTYPPTHGVRLNNGQRLADSNVTLAESLRQAGYQTAAFIGGFPLDPQFGLNQGFDTYNSEFTVKSETSSSHSERSAEEVSLPALAWLDHNHAKPFFLFLHYYDAHLSYKPPEPFATTFADDLYAGEIAYVDRWIGQVVDRLHALHAYDDTLLIITADHGESRGDHGERAHCIFIYQSTQHVPLVIRAPHGASGRRIDTPVSLVDLVPTVLDLCGLQPPERVQGVSVRAGLEGRPLPGRSRPLYCESLEAAQFQCSGLTGLREGSWKYIRAPRQELYDLSKDPGEARNVIEQEGPVALRLRESLETLLQEYASAASPPDAAAADPDAVKRLQSLGYVGSGVAPAGSTFDPKLTDPKDFMKTFERLEHANALFNSNREDEAEKELLEILAGWPRLIAAHEQLAQIARRQHRPADVVARDEKIVAVLTESASDPERRPADNGELAKAHFNLAFALREAGREGDAIAHYEEAIRLKPDHMDARNSLGLVFAHAGRFAEAIGQYREALRIQPDQAKVHNNLGNALRSTGQLEAAIGQYQEALRIEPKSVSALTNLALIRAADGNNGVRNGGEAVRLAERACAVTGRDNVSCLDTLAAAYAEAGRFEEAAATADAAVALARAGGQAALAEDIETRAALYRERRPYRIAAVPTAGSR
jgi:arylsulfatase A-like enzyme/Flp pilus assembly protein TadD